MPSTRWLESRAPRGMVASPHVLASGSGVAALRAGGNALDAAIATAATMAVVYPHMNGVGGDNLWLIYDATSACLTALCGAGRSARAASIEWYARRGVRDAIPSRGGPAAVTVPGVVDGWWQAHQYSTRRLGSALPWKNLLADAVTYAREGFSASDGQRVAPPREPDLFGPTAIPEIKRDLWPLYHPDALAQGLLVQRDLALTLEAVRDGGSEAFYGGDIARRIAAAAGKAGSPLAVEDFAEHRSDWMEPLRIAYRKGHAASFPPPAQGMSALAMLGVADGFDVAELDEADYVHLLVEAAKLAFEDRDRYLTDPAWMEKSPPELLAPEHIADLRSRLDMKRAAPTAAAGAHGRRHRGHRDRGCQGNAVSLIQSLYFTWGSGLVAGDTGVVLQNRGSFFSSIRSRRTPSRREADHAHPDSLHVPRGRAAALRVRNHGRRRPAADPGRAAHAPDRPRSRPAGVRGGAALAVRPHLGHAVARPQPRRAVRPRSRGRSRGAWSRGEGG
jgi:gamma-glutamyltranspeptidase/glutathione hydrolase